MTGWKDCDQPEVLKPFSITKIATAGESTSTIVESLASRCVVKTEPVITAGHPVFAAVYVEILVEDLASL